MRKHCLIASLALVCQLAIVSGEDHWVWRTYNRRERAFKENDREASMRNAHQNQQRREPTTRRPLPGEPENDEIEDYVDVEPTTTTAPNVGTRQYNPYPNPFGGFGGQPAIGGQFPGIGGGFGGGNPGVLVGAGGPTGYRPPLYPNAYQPGNIGFGGAQNGLGLGGYPGIYGGAAASASYPGLGAGAGYPGVGGGAGYPGVGGGASAGTAYPGGQLGGGLGLGQYPGAGSQYPFGSYPGAETNYNQFGAPGGQYPGLAQYPGNQYAGPQYTDGYGLAAGFGLGQPGLAPTGYGGNFGVGGVGYDEKSLTPAEGKSAKSSASSPATVNDKLSKNI
ncbi:elastin [Drosophila montana]|uniref:elastin n=1 Tax=Drosophila montana TaxID=40370 RepID=UPI00313B27B1